VADLVHSARNGYGRCSVVAGCAVFGLPANLLGRRITTLMITQSSLGDRAQSFPGSVLSEPRLDAFVGGLVASHFAPRVFVFGACVFLLGFTLRRGRRSDRSAYRFGGVALTICAFGAENGPGMQVAFHRCASSIGVGVALIICLGVAGEGSRIRVSR